MSVGGMVLKAYCRIRAAVSTGAPRGNRGFFRIGVGKFGASENWKRTAALVLAKVMMLWFGRDLANWIAEGGRVDVLFKR